MREKITLAYVAQMAGVSKAAASQALSGGGGKTTKVSSETTARIRKVANELNYRPNGIARSLSSGKTYSIGIMLGGIHDLFHMELAMNIQQLLLKQGYIGIYTSWDSNDEFDKVCTTVLNRGIDGIITAHYSSVFPASIPVIMFKTKHDHYDYVKVNREMRVKKALSYLMSLGHRQIGFVEGHPEPFLEAMKNKLLPVNPSWIVRSDGFFESGAAAARHFISLDERPTALIVRNDVVAISIISEFQKNGILIPQDISIISFDNIMVSQYTTPALTTFDTKLRHAAELLVDTMLTRLNNPECPQIKREITPKLLIRASCLSILERKCEK